MNGGFDNVNHLPPVELKKHGYRLLRVKNYKSAINTLRPYLKDDPDGELHGVVALSCFMGEDYGQAEKYYQDALRLNPDQGEWQWMCDRARVNKITRNQLFVPPREPLILPELDEESLPSGISAAPPHSLKILRLINDLAGAFLSLTMGLITDIWGLTRGYRDKIWTNWYRRGHLSAVLTLAYMRDRLNRYNLKNVYPGNALVGFAPAGPAKPPGVEFYRTSNGSWNNLNNPLEGAAATRFSRNVESDAIRPESGERLLTPNPRLISRRLLARKGEMAEIPFLNLLSAAWIQFQNHDWISHGENSGVETLDVPLEPDDPLCQRYHINAISIGRTAPDPTRQGNDEPAPVTFLNEVTHWWDGSQIYGSDQKTVDRLRSHVNGKMRLDGRGNLPLDGDGFEDTGFRRNWWVGLSMLHTLFVKEHNAICDHLRASHPHKAGNDQWLFNVARLINAAVMAKIHTVEWTPAILPNPVTETVLNANWYGLATNFFRSKENFKTLSAIRIKNPEIGGVVGNPTDDHGVPYALTEEFVEVYRLHSMLPEHILLRRASTGEISEKLPFSLSRHTGARRLVERMPMPDLLLSFGLQNPGALVLNNYPDFLREMTAPGTPVMDLAAVDILRARERGVPRYNLFRRQLGLHPIQCFDDLTGDSDQVRVLKEVYDDNVEALDLMVGALAEATDRRPEGFGFGETLFQIFILNATRRLQADRFYTSCYNASTYTEEGLAWIDATNLKAVLLRHYPQLQNTGLTNIQNAFEPWDEDAKLDRVRHPLRAFSKSLQPDPWTGDKYRE